jgi:hypothetical protein
MVVIRRKSILAPERTITVQEIVILLAAFDFSVSMYGPEQLDNPFRLLRE